MNGFNNDDVKKMLEMLKEQAESTGDKETKIDTQTTDKIRTDEDIKNMLKKHFSSEQEDSTAARSTCSKLSSILPSSG